jgi:flagellar hook-length control protein FliK
VAGPAVGATTGAVGERAAVLVARDAGTKEPSGKPGTRPDGSANPGSGKEAVDLERTPTPSEGKPVDTPLQPDAAASQRPDPSVELRPAAEARTTGAPGPQPLPSPTAAVTLPQVALTIATRFRAGESRFQIRLDPAELGRIDVDLTVDKGGQATTTLTVERMDTLDLLQRDSRALERALGAAGFKTDQGSLQFNLRDPGQGSSGFQPGQGHAQDQGTPRRFLFAGPSEGAGPSFRTPTADVHPSRLSRLGGLDIRV